MSRCKTLGPLLAIGCAMLSPLVVAQQTIIDSAHSQSYYFVDRYEILIDSSPEDVWSHLLDMGSWMSGMDMVHVSGPPNGEGAVFQIYEGQEFLFEITRLIPNRLILGLNHPSTIQGEESVGMAMFTLTDSNGQTLVSMFMSRHYSWPQDTANPLRATRESEEFLGFTKAMHNGNLARLKDTVESP